MSGITFANLPQLAELDVTENECINKRFTFERGSSRFRRKISRSCGPADVEKKQLLCVASPTCDAFEDDSTCCELGQGTVIDDPNFTFAASANYTGIELLLIEHQPGIEFLPVLVHEKFLMLTGYKVANAPVSKISKRNFEKMIKLELLKLDRNEIEVIKSDTFKDLINLKRIEISTGLLLFFQIL